jgi:hypothetical protein
VTDQVDGFADLLDLPDEPIEILRFRRRESRWQWYAEPGEIDRDDIFAVKMGADGVPKPVGVGYAVDEDCGHFGFSNVVVVVVERPVGRVREEG